MNIKNDIQIYDIVKYMKIEKLFNQIKPIIKNNNKLTAEKKASGEFFNIFSLLGMELDEVHTHSPFLAELLNPNGSHGAKNTFLKLFIDKMPLKTEEKSFLKTGSVIVKKEEYIGEVNYKKETGGEIDILLDFNDSQYAIIIENKIGAGDQKAQLARYHNFAKKHYGNNFTLFYLTLDGHEPTEYSTGKDTKQHYWTCISYKNEIKNWLDECLRDVEINSIARSNIIQYKNLINKLTGRELVKEMNDSIINLMSENKEEVVTILENLTDWKCTLFKREMEKVGQETNCKFVIPENEDVDHPWIWTQRKDYWIYFIPNDYSDCKIWFGRTRNDGPYYYLEKEKTKYPQKQLKCMTDASDNHFKYGSRYLKTEYLSDGHNIVKAICNGKFREYMVTCLTKILTDDNFPK